MKRFAGLFVSGLMLSAGVLVGTPAEAAPAKFIPAKGKAIADQYIVVMKDGPSINAGSAAQSVGATPLHVYDAALNGFAAKLNPGQLKQLQKHPEVAYIEQDAEVSIDATYPVGSGLWGLDRIDQRNLPLNGTYIVNTTASNVTAYIIDTGIYTAHSQFGGRAADAYDAVDGALPATDCQGHGTHVAGTVGGSTYGVAKGVQLRGVRVLDCNGSGSWSGIIAGMNWVANNAPARSVANMSLGGSLNTSVNNAATNMANRGIVVAVSAGNNNANACNQSPAAATGVLTVAASTNTDAKASFSNYGSCVEIYAPGQGIQSAWIGSSTASNTISGTSMASPHVAGVAALVWGNYPTYSSSQVISWIINNATPNKITGNPSGTPNRLLYMGGL